MVLFQAFKHMIHNFQVLLMGPGVDQQIINVNNDIGNIPEYPFHKVLKAGWASKESHG